jgi:hypothetical protein
MLFLVISHPRPERPSEVTNSRQAYWSWIEPKLASGEARSAYPRVGRGVAATFEVPSNERLHILLTEWAEIIPATFDVYPLVDTDAAKAALSGK